MQTAENGAGNRANTRVGVLRYLGVLLVCLAMVAAACDSDSESSSDESSDGTDQPDTDPAEALGEPNPAMGDEPLVVGSFVDVGGAAIDIVEVQVGRQVGEQYTNEYLGGIGVAGQPIEVRYCETRNTAEGATQCANEFVQDGVSAIVGTSSTVAEPGATISTAAGIPYVAAYGAATAELVTPGAYSLTGTTLGVLGAPAVYAQQEGLSTVGVLTIDVPSTTQGLDALATPAYEAAGVGLEVAAVPAGTADMTANVASVPDADLWLVLGDATFCVTALQAIQAQSPDTPTMIVPQCVTPETAGQLTDGLDGVIAVAATRLDPEDPEVQTFDSAVDLYAGEDAEGLSREFMADGFLTITGFASLMEEYEGDGSAASVNDYFDGAMGVLPFSDGTAMHCGASPIAIAPAFCSLSTFLITLDEEGNQVAFEEVDVLPIFAS